MHAMDLSRLEQLGNNAIAQDDLLAACTAYKKLAIAKPNNENILNTTAYVLSRTNQNQEAIHYYKAALQKNPSLHTAHLGMAKAELATGNFKDGWYNFEWRLGNREAYQQAFGYLKLKPRDVKGKRVLIRAEWGLGDMVQFMRYAKLLKQEGAYVILQAFDPLIKLFSRCDFLDKIIGVSDPIPPTDAQIPLLSLPLLFNTTLKTSLRLSTSSDLATLRKSSGLKANSGVYPEQGEWDRQAIPAQIPYIFADPHLIQQWKKELTHDSNFRVGLCWHAKPIYIEDHMFTRRSIPLEAFIPLALPHISFYSLQKEFGVDETQRIASSSLKVHTFNDDFDVTHGRFMDTAAVIMNLDLVISADTSIVHVAGALGKQVWVLLPYAAEWRWLPSHPDYAQSSHTPWYPNNMRLFKQKEPGNWSTVIAEVKQALIELLKEKKA